MAKPKYRNGGQLRKLPPKADIVRVDEVTHMDTLMQQLRAIQDHAYETATRVLNLREKFCGVEPPTCEGEEEDGSGFWNEARCVCNKTSQALESINECIIIME